MENTKLASLLKGLRKAHNYTQYDVASMLGVVRQTYSNYEAGRRTPDSETLYKLAGFYNISVEDLIQLSIDLDPDEYYDAPSPTASGMQLENYLSFLNSPENKKKLQYLSDLEKELLFYFSNLSEKDMHEIIAFTKIKTTM